MVHREGMAGIVRHSQTKGRETGNAKYGLKPPMVRADVGASEIPFEAVPGVGSGRGTQERGQSKRPRIAAGRAATQVGSRRSTGGGRPRAVWQRGRATSGRVHGGSADKFGRRKTLRRHRGDPRAAGDAGGSSSPSTETITQESGLREDRTSRLSERTEEGRKPGGAHRLTRCGCGHGRR